MERAGLRRRLQDNGAPMHLLPRQRTAVTTNTAAQGTTIVRTVTAPAPAATTTSRSIPAGGLTTVETTNGVVFTIVVQQVNPTTSSTTASSTSSSSFSNPFFSLPSAGARSSTTSSSTVTAVVQTVTANANGQTGSLAMASGIVNPTVSNDSAGGLSTGAIVGIALGAFAAVVLALALCFWCVGSYRDRRAREEVTDMMGTSNLPDPYAGAFISREVPGSFVRFNDDDDMGSFGGGERPQSGYGAPAATGGNAYDDLSNADDDYGDAGGSQRPLSPFRGSRAYGGTY